MHLPYRGDLSPKQAWEKLKDDINAVMVDVRTTAELHYVGTPDLRPIAKHIIPLEFRQLPNMDYNPKFIENLTAKITDKDASIIFICRTGGRSQEAAIWLTELGYNNCYNLENGFEGELDNHGHRGNVNGWKADKLPWRQD